VALRKVTTKSYERHLRANKGKLQYCNKSGETNMFRRVLCDVADAA